MEGDEEVVDDELIEDDAQEATETTTEQESGSEHQTEEPGEEIEIGGFDEAEAPAASEEKAEEEQHPQGPAPKWLKDLRKSHTKLAKENRELRERLESKETEKKPDLGPKPKFEDFNFDEEKFEKALLDWNGKKSDLEKAKTQEQLAAEEQQKAWQARLGEYDKRKSALKVEDFEEVEEIVKLRLNNVQQSIIIDVADKPAELIYALGKSPETLKRLSGLSPAKFAAEIGKLEATKLKVVKRAPPPETVVRSNGVGSTDKMLQRLMDEADRTGDRTKVVAYRKKLRTEQRK